ncbi:1,2-phenylacetyl-CoA epoxidase subunit PaaD [Noviherbaspirillum saxi]|uniref:Phenylacetate-CoA oxygenase subunit PaaJ n=1 Tax=Noviherbaspirillum saxi TaxID=2320863 RepID=A0A3A3FL01_9BURK|nr:1,2-phenylacetyl-CoA epoxidase subunit PaaD [Noviherbaspirillum saxi]RJF95977.1 phenylacetate-CoA oxygenase subunit PaaJ [Noviherbaspirillum saxi]
MVSAVLATTDEVWTWLAEVADPEIPVISVVDLGIVRDVIWSDGQECVVTVTPTYSGCPATQVISDSISDALASRGITQHRIEIQLSPAWTTDWLSESGRQKLKAYGIAPPSHQRVGQQVIDISRLSRKADDALQVPCPNCGSVHTRMTSQFGSTPCKALYRCDDCLEPFDYFKSH